MFIESTLIYSKKVQNRLNHSTLLYDGEVERWLSNLKTYSFVSRDEQEVLDTHVYARSRLVIYCNLEKARQLSIHYHKKL